MQLYTLLFKDHLDKLFLYSKLIFIQLKFRTCNDNECPTWTPWTTWTTCSLTCGGGTHERTRKCEVKSNTYNGKDVKLFCPGDSKEIEKCNKDQCPGKKYYFLYLRSYMNFRTCYTIHL